MNVVQKVLIYPITTFAFMNISCQYGIFVTVNAPMLIDCFNLQFLNDK